MQEPEKSWIIPIAKSRVQSVLGAEDHSDAHALWSSIDELYSPLRTVLLLAEALNWTETVDHQYELNHATASTPVRGRSCMQSRDAFVAKMLSERRRSESPFGTTDEDTMRADAAEDWRYYAAISADSTVTQARKIISIARRVADWIRAQTTSQSLAANVSDELLALRAEILTACETAQPLLVPIDALARRLESVRRLGKR